MVITASYKYNLIYIFDKALGWDTVFGTKKNKFLLSLGSHSSKLRCDQIWDRNLSINYEFTNYKFIYPKFIYFGFIGLYWTRYQGPRFVMYHIRDAWYQIKPILSEMNASFSIPFLFCLGWYLILTGWSSARRILY